MATLTNVFLHLILHPFQLHISKKCCNFAGEMRILAGYIWQYACRLVCVLGLVCSFASCGWQEAKEVIVLADSIDQTEHVIYDDTAALGKAIRSLDNPFGRLLMPNTLGKAYYYMGRNLSFANEIADAAKCYIEADRLQIDDPIYRGRVNVCMANICAQNSCDSLALIFYERASENFQESGNDWYYAHTLLDKSESRICIRDYAVADTLLQIAQSYQLDSAYRARYLETHGLYFYEQQQYDSALIYFNQGSNYWQFESEKCFGYLKILQVYYDLNKLHLTIPYAKFIVEHSTNPNYFANAYYCLMQDAKNQNNVELLSQYSHARTDAQQELREYMLQDAEALPILEEYLRNPHPWRWVWITISSIVVLCILSIMCVFVYRQRVRAASERIEVMSEHIQNQATYLLHELHNRQLQDGLFNILDKYYTPPKRWREFSLLQRDIDAYLHDWLQALALLPLSDQEKLFCTISLIYPHMTDVEIADLICYGKDGIRVFKNRILKKLNVAPADFPDFLRELSAPK